MTHGQARNFILWRQDDTGQQFKVEEFASRDAAVHRLQELEANKHKQTYWIDRMTTGPPQVNNLSDAVPEHLTTELTTPLLENHALHLSRIVSRQHANKEGEWYDQPEDEWVLLVSGSAGLRFKGEKQIVALKPGDYLLIPAHCQHRIDWTDPQHDTLWLALHLKPAQET